MLMTQVRSSFRIWYQNRQFHKHILRVEGVLDEVQHLYTAPPDFSAYFFVPCETSTPFTCSVISLDQLFERNVPQIHCQPSILVKAPRTSQSHATPTNTLQLKSLLSEFRHSSTNTFHRLYGNDLDQSRKSLENDSASEAAFDRTPHSMDTLIQHRNKCREYLQAILAPIRRTLSPSNVIEKTMFTAGLWPRTTTTSLLGTLAFNSTIVPSRLWQKMLILLAQALLRFQHSQRLIKLARNQNDDEFLKEAENKVPSVSDATQYPDWLLIQVVYYFISNLILNSTPFIQIESNFLARPIQTKVAREMIAPRKGQNAVLQLNMGEGKSSVIVPMVATALANGLKFVRVIVLKSLANQMFQLLVERLTGLANRRIFYMPFSRTAKLGTQEIMLIQKLYKKCMEVGGILVTQPEHLLSFKLMGIDQRFHAISPAEHVVGDDLLEIRRWLEENSRDILDESDEILHVRYQLVYTVGQQRSLEGHPDRWTTVQQILSLALKHAAQIQEQFPLGIELQKSTPGSYPFLRILQSYAGMALVSLIAKDVLDGGLSNYSFGLLPTPVRRSALFFITKMDGIPASDVHLVEEYFRGTGSWKALLLLRGLLVHGILLYILKDRRWRVDYGLDHSRSLLAVPYRAKDIPALKAEFGHPDVAIALTCLSYYYQGLSQDQLDQSFELLYMLDNPTAEYENWIGNNDSIPEQLQRLSGVNTSDPEQCRQHLFPLFHRSLAVINFFLLNVVFPKQAKEFPEKLSTSGWDLAENKRNYTTGFSGTNDNRYLLPTSIIQDDPAGQLSTNAKVLTFILQPENNHYLCTYQNGQQSSTTRFLHSLINRKPDIRVLLDVGAQMLDLQNDELAKEWLSLRPDVSAAIFFGDNDVPFVLTRDGGVESFISSPFNQQLDKCLVYLDDAHTRGTDLKLPRNSRAAVTLGPKVTKDRLLQGQLFACIIYRY
jgi:hypothetical protein